MFRNIKSKAYLGWLAALVLAAALMVHIHCHDGANDQDSDRPLPAKYIFLFIGDGMTYAQIMAFGIYFGAVDPDQSGLVNNLSPKGAPRLALPSFTAFPVTGAMISTNAGRIITDSASAATAMACGVKTHSGMLGLNADHKRRRSLAEFLKSKGFRVGLVSSMSLNHATPAGFYAHRQSREDYYNIGRDLVASGFDYFGGGGLYRPHDPEGRRPDLFQLAAKAGYRLVDTAEGLRNLSPEAGRVIAVNPALNREACMNFALDVQDSAEPRLRDFVRQGISLLDNEQGFFLMVEGGKIDLAAHANDAYTAILELKDFDDSLAEALTFARRHPRETLIVVLGDHETGGLSLGFGGQQYEIFPARLSRQKMSYRAFSDRYIGGYRRNQIPFEKAMEDIRACFGLILPDTSEARTANDPGLILSPGEVELLRAAYAQSIQPQGQRYSYDYLANYSGLSDEPFTLVATRILSHKAGLGWTSSAHTALPVSVHAWGSGAELFTGFYDNTEIFNKLKQAAGH